MKDAEKELIHTSLSGDLMKFVNVNVSDFVSKNNVIDFAILFLKSFCEKYGITPLQLAKLCKNYGFYSGVQDWQIGEYKIKISEVDYAIESANQEKIGSLSIKKNGNFVEIRRAIDDDKIFDGIKDIISIISNDTFVQFPIASSTPEILEKIIRKTNLTRAAAKRNGNMRDETLKFLKETNEAISVYDLSAKTGFNYNSLVSLTTKLKKEGLVTKEGVRKSKEKSVKITEKGIQSIKDA